MLVLVALIWLVVGYKAANTKRAHWFILVILSLIAGIGQFDRGVKLAKKAGASVTFSAPEAWLHMLSYAAYFAALWSAALLLGVWVKGWRSRARP